MIQLVKETLMDSDIPEDSVHFELFTETEIKDDLPERP